MSKPLTFAQTKPKPVGGGDAASVARKTKSKAIVIIQFWDDGRVGGASYGGNNATAHAAEAVLLEIIDTFVSGRTRLPRALEPESGKVERHG